MISRLTDFFSLRFMMAAAAMAATLAALVTPAHAKPLDPADAPPGLWAIGTAWTQDGTQVQYYEYHYAEDVTLDLPTRVEYRTPTGDVFAYKHIDYSRSVIAPAITQTDLRTNTRLLIEHPEEPAARIIRVNWQSDGSSAGQQGDVNARNPLIVDAGFDPFIRENWDDLVSGRRVTTDFLVPARLDSVRIGITRTRDADCRASAEQIACFVIRPAGMLRVVGWLVDPILIGYDLQTRRLLVFDGLSNLRDDAGEPRNALITFEYL